MSAPDHITEFVCEDCGGHVHVFGHYYGLPGHSTCPLHPRTSDMPSTSSRGICEATLTRVANAKGPWPTMLSSERGPTEDEDGRWTMRPDAIASSGSLSRRNCSSDHTRSRADSGYTWRGRCYSRRPSRRPETHPHWHLHSSRGDDESDARPKRQK